MPTFVEVYRPGFITTLEDYEWNPEKVLLENFVQQGYPLDFRQAQHQGRSSNGFNKDVFCYNSQFNPKLLSRLNIIESLPDYLFLKNISRGYLYDVESIEGVLNTSQVSGEILGINWKQFVYLTENDFRQGLVRSLLLFSENLERRSQMCLAGEWIYRNQDWSKSNRIEIANEHQIMSKSVRSIVEKTGVTPLSFPRMKETIQILMNRVDLLLD